MEKKTPIRLSRPVIVEAALAIIDRDGLPGLSMRNLGSRLHVEGMALYRYFPDKETILDEVVTVVLEGTALPSDDVGWTASLRTAELSLREHLLMHPNVMPLVASRWKRIPVLSDLEQNATEALLGAGFDVNGARALMSAVMSLVLGHAWIGVEGYVGELPDSGGLTRRPARPVLPHHATADQEESQREFERGLDLLLEGARTTLT